MARFSCGQSFRILFKSRLIPRQMIGHLLFNCQSRREGVWRFAPEGRERRTENSGQRSVELFTGHSSLVTVICPVESAIESFIRYLAVERGLSDNYQLS